MEVFVVMEAKKDHFSNDWENLEYYNEFNCTGVYSTFDLAVNSTGVNPSNWIEGSLNDEGLALGEGWRDDKYSCYFIVRRILIVK
jgi:hypothetical protein